MLLPSAAPAHDGTRPDEWVQVGLALPGPPAATVYREVSALVTDWLGTGVVSEFFFMHKPPGLRLRFAPAPGTSNLVREQTARHVRQWRQAGLISGAESVVYEPEAHLFGGPASMWHVHRLFTVDAVAWLDFLAAPRRVPAWSLSLLMLRDVFTGLRITGWEDRDVWARVAGAGRMLRRDAVGTIDTKIASARLREAWDRPEELAAALPDDVRRIADRHAKQAEPLLSRWWTGYFGSGHAAIGPRQAAAHYVVFHWNRAALRFGSQILITDSLGAIDGAADVR